VATFGNMRSIDPGNRWTLDVVMFTATIWSVLGAGTGFCDQNRPAAEQNNAPELPSGLNLNFNIAGGNPVIVVDYEAVCFSSLNCSVFVVVSGHGVSFLWSVLSA